MFQNSRQIVRAGAFALSVFALFAAGNANAGRMFDLVPKPVRADSASVARGTSSPRASVQQWHHQQFALGSTAAGEVKLSAMSRDARCDVRDTCSAGQVGAIESTQPAIRAEGNGEGTVIR